MNKELSKHSDWVPPHISGLYLRACDKSKKAHRNWRKLFIIIGEAQYARSRGGYNRLRMWARIHCRWSRRIQVISPWIDKYIQGSPSNVRDHRAGPDDPSKAGPAIVAGSGASTLLGRDQAASDTTTGAAP